MKPIDTIKNLINNNSSFVLEAGAGSGKTFTLIETLNYIIETRGDELRYLHKTIVCITYTNVAKNEILGRLENNPLVSVHTIHEFLWSVIKNFQTQLLKELDALNTEYYVKKPEKFEPDLLHRNLVKEVIYNDSGFRDFEAGQLHHDDVIILAKAMFKNYPLIAKITAEKHPFIFIDEYQDTASETVELLLDYLLGRSKSEVLVGFFGDSYQKIYDSGIGTLEGYVSQKKLIEVKKDDNYRSSIAVIDVLNNIRENIKQIPPSSKAVPQGSAIFINCDNYPERMNKEKITDYEKRLVPQKNSNYDKVVKFLEELGWQMGADSPDKVLIIANSRVAERGGFRELFRTATTRYYDPTDMLMKRENILIRFFLGSVDKATSKERKTGVEHLMGYWQQKDYSHILYYLNHQGDVSLADGEAYFKLRKHKDKVRISATLEALYNLRLTGTIGEVFNFVTTNGIIRLSEGLIKYLQRVRGTLDAAVEGEERERLSRDITFFNTMMQIPYQEIINLFRHTQDQTVFSTKHGTKGDEFRNVLVIIDDTSWKQMYNFEKYFDNSEENGERRLRSKNLFYVSCSRAEVNLVVLSLSQMGESAMHTIEKWFKSPDVMGIDDVPV